MKRITIALVLIALSGAASAATLNYTSQTRTVSAFVPDAEPPELKSALDFGFFDESNFRSGELTGDTARAGHTSSLNADSLDVNLFSDVFSGAFDRGQAVATSKFEVEFTLTQGQHFNVTGQLTTGAENSAIGDTANFLLETLGGSEITLDWIEQGGTAGIDLALDSTVYLAAGSYRLFIETGALMDCLSNCGLFDDERRGEAAFAMSVVPIPPALLLFPSALVALGWMRRKSD